MRLYFGSSTFRFLSRCRVIISLVLLFWSKVVIDRLSIRAIWLMEIMCETSQYSPSPGYVGDDGCCSFQSVCPSVAMADSLSLCLSFFVFLSVCQSISLKLYVWPSFSLSVCFRFVFVSICLLSVCLSLWSSVFQSFYMSVSFLLFFFVCLCVLLFASLFFCLSVLFFFSLFLCLSVNPCVLLFYPR
jgi:hypothetical protein